MQKMESCEEQDRGYDQHMHSAAMTQRNYTAPQHALQLADNICLSEG